MTLYSVQYGETTIEYQLSFAARKTLAIEVHPDLRVTVRAPEGSELETIRQKVKKRAPWILRQQRQFESYLPKLPPANTSAARPIATWAANTGSKSARVTPKPLSSAGGSSLSRCATKPTPSESKPC